MISAYRISLNLRAERLLLADAEQAAAGELLGQGAGALFRAGGDVLNAARSMPVHVDAVVAG
jgi:hypothetical protein